MASAVQLVSRGISTLLGFACHPLVAGPVAFTLTYGPSPLKDALVQVISRQSVISVDSTITAFKVLFVVGFTATANRILNRIATNHWRIQRNDGWQWDKEIAVVTGGCSGIGMEVVRGLAGRGVRTVVLDILPLPKDMEQLTNISLIPCDISTAGELNRAAKAVQESIGHPSILVNNAGIGRLHSIMDTTDEALVKIFNVNVLSHWATTKLFLPDMIRKNKGHVITVASLASFTSLPMLVDYCATKAGALAFHEGLSGELRHVYHAPGVMTTIAHPGWTRTTLIDSFIDKIERREGNLLTPEKVAKPILEQIFICRGGQLFIPRQRSLLSGFRGWTNWAQELLRDSAGRNYAR